MVPIPTYSNPMVDSKTTLMGITPTAPISMMRRAAPLLAATIYRLALLTGQGEFIAQAERTRASIFSTNGSLSKDQDGWLAPIVDPLNVAVEGKHSLEGEAFVLMLYAA
jgi:hypothetical protein